MKEPSSKKKPKDLSILNKILNGTKTKTILGIINF